jgi:hypothetical protein
VQLSAQGQIGIGGRPMLDALAVGPVLFFLLLLRLLLVPGLYGVAAAAN